MKQTSRYTTLILLLMAVALLVGAGCSHDSAVAPIGAASDLTIETSKTVPATTFVETYDSRRNVGGWSFYTTNKLIFEDIGGNPGGYLHDDHVVSFAPHPGTEAGGESVFTGNYRDRKITSLGIDLRSIDYEYDITSRYLTLMLMHDNGTPDDEEDDWGAYYIGTTKLPSKYVAWYSSTVDAITNEPGWVSYDFVIPSQDNNLPEGWTFWHVGIGGEMTGGSWSDLMKNVSYVRYYYGDPELYYILQSFDLGLDNPRISWEE